MDYWFQLFWINLKVVSIVQGKSRNGSTVSQGVELEKAKASISLIARFWIASSVARECLEAPTDESSIRDRGEFEPYIYKVKSWLGVK